MKKQTRNILVITGVISTIMGIIGAIPSLLQEKYGVVTEAAILIAGGLLLLAIAFND